MMLPRDEFRDIDVPDWMIPPRLSGWEADDLDHPPDAMPDHTEILDGALVVMMAPQRSWHANVVDSLKFALKGQAPDTLVVQREMAIKLDKRDRPEPDVLIVQAAADTPDATSYDAADVILVIEVESPESMGRDRDTKPHKYARAGIGFFWRVEDRDGKPIVRTYALDPATKKYAHTGTHTGNLTTDQPFPITIDTTTLA